MLKAWLDMLGARAWVELTSYTELPMGMGKRRIHALPYQPGHEWEMNPSEQAGQALTAL